MRSRLAFRGFAVTGALYLVQGSTAWTLVPTPVGADQVDALNVTGQIDGSNIPADMMSMPAPMEAPAPTDSSAPPVGLAPASTSAPAIASRDVQIQGKAFNQQALTVLVGTNVKWTNGDQEAHTVTWDDRSIDSGAIEPGHTFDYTFTKPGTYGYYCIPHGSPGAGMHGTITVTSE